VKVWEAVSSLERPMARLLAGHNHKVGSPTLMDRVHFNWTGQGKLNWSQVICGNCQLSSIHLVWRTTFSYLLILKPTDKLQGDVPSSHNLNKVVHPAVESDHRVQRHIHCDYVFSCLPCRTRSSLTIPRTLDFHVVLKSVHPTNTYCNI